MEFLEREFVSLGFLFRIALLFLLGFGVCTRVVFRYLIAGNLCVNLLDLTEFEVANLGI